MLHNDLRDRRLLDSASGIIRDGSDIACCDEGGTQRTSEKVGLERTTFPAMPLCYRASRISGIDIDVDAFRRVKLQL